MVERKGVVIYLDGVIEAAGPSSTGLLKLQHDGGWLTETFFSNEAIAQRDPELHRVYEHFDDQHAPCDIEVLSVRAPNCLFHLVDTQPHNPAGYRIVRYDTRATLDGGRDYTGLLIGDYPARVYRENLQQQLGTAWAMHTSRYSEVVWSRDVSERRRFHRLLVPLHKSQVPIEGGGLLVATRPQPAGGGLVAGKLELTPREIEVLHWTSLGKTSRDIALIIGRSVSTVNFHLQSAMVKLEANNKVQAVLKAHQLGYLGD